jgi:hypothetical protein
MFGIEEMAKGFFPHFFEPQDGSDRLGYVGALPHFSYYMPDLMSTERRAEFFKWYAEERKVYEEGGWVLRDHLERYCLSDCMVLAEGVIRYRNIFMSEIVAPALKGEHSVYKDMKGVEELMGRQEVGDPFVYTTLSSYILALYKALFMPAYTIGITPRPVGVSSLECEQWLRDIEVNTLKRPLEREYKVPEVGQCVDGYDAETKTIYQYHGCWYHGCKRCKTYPTHSSSAALLRARTRWMTCRYRQLGYTIVEKWGCDWKGDIEFRLGMQRDMRGRVEGEAGEEERREQEAARLAGQALDEQVLEDGKVDRRWARSEKERSGDQELWDAEGLVPTQQIKASLPPPLRSVLQGGRVEVFKFYYKVHQPGEKICYVDVNSLYPSVMIRNLYPVGHPRIEKGDNLELKHWHFGFVHCHVEPPKDLAKKVEDFGDKLLFDLNDKWGIWTTEELRVARALAYKITEVRQIWHFPKRRDDLYTGFMDLFWKMRLAAKKAGNKGLQYCLKLCLNSLWGRMGMRLERPKTKYFTSSEDMAAFMLNTHVTVESWRLINGVAIVSYLDAEVDNSLLKDNSIYQGAFVTSYARLKLYEKLHLLMQNDQVLYCDTDSIIYRFRPGTADIEVKCSKDLGEWGDELEVSAKEGSFPERICEHVGLAPKMYSFTNEGRFLMEVACPSPECKLEKRSADIIQDSPAFQAAAYTSVLATLALGIMPKSRFASWQRMINKRGEWVPRLLPDRRSRVRSSVYLAGMVGSVIVQKDGEKPYSPILDYMTPEERKKLFSGGYKQIFKQLEKGHAVEGAKSMEMMLRPYTEECKKCTRTYQIKPRFSPYEVHCKTKGLTMHYANSKLMSAEAFVGLVKGEIVKVASAPTPQVVRDRGRGAMSRWVMKQIAMDWNNKRLPLPPRNPYAIDSLPHGHVWIEQLYGPLKVGTKKSEKPEPVYFRKVFLNVCLPRMGRMNEEGMLGELIDAMEKEDVPLYIRDNIFVV